jgi:hypothetical protein
VSFCQSNGRCYVPKRASYQTSPTLRHMKSKNLALSYGSLIMLAVAATSPGYAATYTYGAPHAVDSPPAQAASCASTTAATSETEAGSAASASAAAATAASATATTTTAMATPTTATSSELNSGLERTGVFFVEDVEGSQADVRDFFLTQKDAVAQPRIWRRVHECLSGRATRKRQQASGAQSGHGFAPAFSDRHLLRL